MKKIFITALVLTVFVNSYGQEKRVTISEDKVGPVNLEYIKSINIDKADTSYYVVLAFRNQEYSYITDTKVILLKDTAALSQLVTDLNAASAQMETKEKVDVSWPRSRYQLQLYDFNANLYLMNGKAYTRINQNQVNNLAASLKKIKIGVE